MQRLYWMWTGGLPAAHDQAVQAFVDLLAALLLTAALLQRL